MILEDNLKIYLEL